MRDMSILIFGDTVPTKSNEMMFMNGDAEALVGSKLLHIMEQSDFRIMNMECPLADQVSPITKCGPRLRASEKTICGYKALGINLVTLANNHVNDQGADGIASTCRVLKQENISYIGAGDTLRQAEMPHCFSLYGKKIGIYACTEHEFSIAQEHSPGANPFDALESPDHIAALKSVCDYVIVLYHGGREHYRYPSPDLRKTCRKLVDKGADLVVCQHSHCVGCEERYQERMIVYGQGNFIFDHSDDEHWQTGLVLCIDENFHLSYIPIKKNGAGVCYAEDQEASAIMEAFMQRSGEIISDATLEQKYQQQAENALNAYLLNVLGIQRGNFYRICNKILKGRLPDIIVKRKFTHRQLMVILQYLRCESHREILLRGIRDRIHNNDRI